MVGESEVSLYRIICFFRVDLRGVTGSSRYPMISNFLKDKMSRFGSSVKLKPSRGNTPYIKLRTAQKKSSEKISIESWKTEDIEEFLEQKLKL